MHRDLANPPITLPQYVPADSADIAASLDVRDVCGAATTELSALLERPLNVFWSYVLHCPALMAFIDSYLRFAPRNLGLHSEEANLPRDGLRMSHICLCCPNCERAGVVAEDCSQHSCLGGIAKRCARTMSFDETRRAGA